MLKSFDDIKIFEEVEYSFEKIAARERICGITVISPQNSFCTVCAFSPCGTDFPAAHLSDADKSAILSHLKSFSNKILLCEIDAKLCAFLPTFYPSSSLCVVLVFDGRQFTASEILRLIAHDECPDIFVMSDSVTGRATRISDALLTRGKVFFELCRQLHGVMLELGAPFEYATDGDCKALAKRLLELSEIIGCPIESLSFEEGIKPSSLFDLPLLLSFVITFMLVALNDAPARSIGISLYELSGQLCVRIMLDRSCNTSSLPFIEWEATAADKNMFFAVDSEDEAICVSFQPIRHDWSHLGLKQNTEFI